MKKHIFLLLLSGILYLPNVFAQRPGYWQQRAEYIMDIDFDVEKHRFKGKQKLIYHNNSPDELDRVFYHLYFNAFQPGSMMDVRSRTIMDPDPRVRDRIAKLKADEIGYHKILSLKQNGKPLNYEVVGTVLEVQLAEPIKPGKKAVFEMEFESQVPVQIRRSGRNNAEGIAYSMTQWYPKMAEYDEQGWHAHPYIGREFYGVWGSFDVTIHIDSSYVVAATGVLQNPQEIGHGYEDKNQALKRPKGNKLHWHFKAENVHDFAWAADPDYQHTTAQVPGGPTLHFFFQADANQSGNWDKLPGYMIEAFQIMNREFGQYPYPVFSFVQGGDGGMEYPMLTLIVGRGSLDRLVGVATHEFIHNWYYGILATNEALYPWMDEGFTSFAEDYVFDKIMGIHSPNPFKSSYDSYFRLVQYGLQEPLSTHADHYNTNMAYSIASYSMGAIFLRQLSYIIGEEAFRKGMLDYFNTWKFKHPTPNDFIRIMEKASGLELDWYKEYWIYSTKHIDYAIDKVVSKGTKTEITLRRVKEMPMPIDLHVTLASGEKHIFHIPLQIMRGAKKGNTQNYHVEADWGWVYPTYTFEIPFPIDNIRQIVIDPEEYMADIDRGNNTYPADSSLDARGK
jgi:hypothetical protein